MATRVKRMKVKNQVKGDRTYFYERLAIYQQELLAASERGERNQCEACKKWAVKYFEEGPNEEFMGQCENCGKTF